MSAPPLTRRVQFFTGKGGVGKSTILSAVASATARVGRRPLIVELGLHTASSRSFGSVEVGHAPREVAPGVHATRIEFEPALIEYVASRLKLRTVSRLVARNRSLRRLFLAAPGVDEIVTLHRVAQLEADGRWDPILVDLESTGHALMFFDLPSVLSVFLKDGPLRQVVDGATRLIGDAERCAVHIVTVPEPLAVSETIELYRDLAGRHDLHLGHLFINRVPRRWLDDDERALVAEELQRSEGSEPWVPDLELAEYVARRRNTADKCLRGLARDVPLPSMTFDAHPDDPEAIVEAVAGRVARLEAL